MARKSVTDRLQGFEDIKRIDADGTEYWSARELMSHLGYGTWENFDAAIQRAQTSVAHTGTDVNLVFREVTNHYKSRNRFGEFERTQKDYHITRQGCYLVAQNGDPSKEAIAGAQAYFAQQTIRQEQYDRLPENLKRLYVRQEVLDKNKKLNAAAAQSGVKNYGRFHDAGYQGLYGMRLSSVVKRKGLGKDKLLDRAGSTELAANLFRITQTEEKLSKEVGQGNSVGQYRADQVHKTVGRKVREAIKEIGGTMPEDLLPESHINELTKQIEEDGEKLAAN